MTFIITLYVREGVVMASDSRLSLNQNEQTGPNAVTRLDIAQSDANYKTFLTPNQVGISTFGAADIGGVPISGFIQSFIEEQLHEGDSVAATPQLLLDYFRAQPGPPAVFFHVAAYDTDASGHREQFVWRVDVVANLVVRRNPPNTGVPTQGAAWDGELDVLSRLLARVQFLNALGAAEVDMPAPQIPWNFFTLQDAIDFALYAVRTTSDTIRFQVRPKTVGGPIDVLVLLPSESHWVQRKELHV